MNSHTRLSSHPAVWLGLLVAPFAAFAQQTPPPAAATSAVAAAAKDEEAVVLSPFEVRTEKDTGFAASSALAGGRLATDLKDTPVAYSVMNRDMIDALGITNLTEALNWTTNTIRFPDGTGAGDTFNITVPASVRGVLGVYNLRQRNFFVNFGPMLSYNVERFDFGRGPNQILYGNGSVGGTGITMTRRARTDKPFETATQTFGSWHNMRTEVDINRPINDKLAFRLDGVFGDRAGWRLNEMAHDTAIFMTTLYKPTRNTELRAEAEFGEAQSRTPYAQLNDRLGGWDGKTTYSGLLPTNPANANVVGVDHRTTNYFVYNPYAKAGTVMNYFNDPMTRGAGDQPTTPAGPYTYANAGNASFNTSGASMLHALDMPAGRFDTAIANSSFRLPSESFTMAPNAPNADQHFKDLQLTLDHHFGQSIYLELAGDLNSVHTNINRVEGNVINTYIDINKILPDGSPNSRYLQPYGDGQYQVSVKKTDAQSVRGAVAYVTDLGKWGNYSFNMMGGLTHQFIGSYFPYLTTGTVGGGTDNRAWGNSSFGIRQRFYWSDPHPFMPPTTPVTFVDPNTNVTKQITPFWAFDNTSFNNENEQDNYYNYGLGAMNAKFFKGRLVVLAAGRYDNSRQDLKYTRLPGDYPTDWNGRTLLWRPDAPADWKTLTYIPKNAAGVATAPAHPASARPRTNNSDSVGIAQAQYANDRFQDDFNPPETNVKKWTPSVGTVIHVTPWMGLSYNYARAISFNASAAPDPNNNLLPPVVGWGWDVSARFSLLQNRLNFTATTYKNIEFGNYIDPTAVTGQINNLYNFSPRLNASGVANTLVNQGNLRNAALISSVVRDTRTRIADGYEFEAVANITRGWRLQAGLGLPHVWQKAFAPITRAYVASHTELLKQVLQDAGGVVGSDGVAVLNPDTTQRGIDAQNAVTAYNNIYTNLKNQIPDLQRALTAPYNGSILTDYTFQSGKLKNLRVGTGMNWQGRRVVGYRGGDTIVNPANPATAIDDPTVDAHNVVWAPGATIWRIYGGYTWKLRDQRELSVNGSILNLFNNRKIIYTDNSVTLRPLNNDYTLPARVSVPNAVSYQQPINYTLSITLRM